MCQRLLKRMIFKHVRACAAGGGVCMFTFEELCGRPVAAADYIALAERFHTVALEGVPEFSGATRSQVCSPSSSRGAICLENG